LHTRDDERKNKVLVFLPNRAGKIESCPENLFLSGQLNGVGDREPARLWAPTKRRQELKSRP